MAIHRSPFLLCAFRSSIVKIGRWESTGSCAHGTILPRCWTRRLWPVQRPSRRSLSRSKSCAFWHVTAFEYRPKVFPYRNRVLCPTTGKNNCKNTFRSQQDFCAGSKAPESSAHQQKPCIASGQWSLRFFSAPFSWETSHHFLWFRWLQSRHASATQTGPRSLLLTRTFWMHAPGRFSA